MAIYGCFPLLRSAGTPWTVPGAQWSCSTGPRGQPETSAFGCSAGRRARQPAAQQVCLGPGHPLHCCSRPGHLAGAAALLEDGPHRAEGCCATGQSCRLRAPRWMCCTSQGCHAVVLPFCLPLEWASLTDMAGGYWPGLLAGAVQPVGLACLQGEVDCSTLAAACCCLPDQLRQQRMHSSGTRCLCALPPAP